MIENSFGILAARWRLFRRPIIASPQRVRLYVQAAVALHNFPSLVYTVLRGLLTVKMVAAGMKSISQAGRNMCVGYCYTDTLGQ